MQNHTPLVLCKHCTHYRLVAPPTSLSTGPHVPHHHQCHLPALGVEPVLGMIKAQACSTMRTASRELLRCGPSGEFYETAPATKAGAA